MKDDYIGLLDNTDRELKEIRNGLMREKTNLIQKQDI